MGFELQSGTMYINGEPFGEIKECEITESSIDDRKIIGIDLAKSSDVTLECDCANWNWNTFMKLCGLKWYQRMWIKIKMFFYNATHKRKVD